MKKLSLRALLTCLLAMFLASCSSAPRVVIEQKPSAPVAAVAEDGAYDVHSFGAVGNGKTNDTAAFQKAFDACAKAGGGTVSVPGGVYLIGSIVIGTNTTLRLDNRPSLLGSPDIEDYPLIKVRWEGEFRPGHRAMIYAERTGHIQITGRGFIYGPPISVSRLRDPRGPALMEFSKCEGVTLDGFTTQYQQLWSIHPVLCKNFVARNLTIRSVASNGDGIDVDSCSGVLIERCNMDTGDDSISLKSGRGLSAARLGRPTEDVTIRDCTLNSSSFAGLGVGTELSGGIRNVRVENCFISGRQNAIYLKSRDGRGAAIENFTCENLTVQNSPTFVAIDLLKKGIQASDPIPGDVEKWTAMRNITFNNITVHNITDLVLATAIPPERPVENLTLTNIKGDCAHAIRLANITNAVLSGIEVTGFSGELITKTNVTGSGLGATQP